MLPVFWMRPVWPQTVRARIDVASVSNGPLSRVIGPLCTNPFVRTGPSRGRDLWPKHGGGSSPPTTSHRKGREQMSSCWPQGRPASDAFAPIPDSTSTPWDPCRTRQSRGCRPACTRANPCALRRRADSALRPSRYPRTPASQIEQTPVLLQSDGQPRGRSLRTLIQVPAGLPWAQEHRPERAVLSATDLEARPPDGTLVAAGSRAERQTCTRLGSRAVAYRIGDLARPRREGLQSPITDTRATALV